VYCQTSRFTGITINPIRPQADAVNTMLNKTVAATDKLDTVNAQLFAKTSERIFTPRQ
jgi:hypothetical protein